MDAKGERSRGGLSRRHASRGIHPSACPSSRIANSYLSTSARPALGITVEQNRFRFKFAADRRAVELSDEQLHRRLAKQVTSRTNERKAIRAGRATRRTSSVAKKIGGG
jgi:hypothetical protein